MYIPDGSKLDYNSRREEPWNYSFGWLENESFENCKITDKEKCCLIKILTDIHGTEYSLNNTRGIHICGICGKVMGNATIRISYMGKIYIAPSDVVHYVKDHGYVPPREAVNAVLKGYFLKEKDWSIDFDDMATDEEIDLAWGVVIEKAIVKGFNIIN
jgi:hypothetical protein